LNEVRACLQTEVRIKWTKTKFSAFLETTSPFWITPQKVSCAPLSGRNPE